MGDLQLRRAEVRIWFVGGKGLIRVRVIIRVEEGSELELRGIRVRVRLVKN